jgi:flagellar basal-body rod protein FlgB
MSTFSGIQMLQGYMQVVTDRQQQITSNIANVDTPGYHSKDVNFQQAMERVITGTHRTPRWEQCGYRP